MKARKEIQEMRAYSAPTSQRQGQLRLDFNENLVGIPKTLLKSLSVSPAQISIYPNYITLEKAIAKYAKVKENEVIASNGSDDAIRIAFDCFLKAGKKVVLPWPSFAMFEQYARIAGGKIKKILYDKGFEFPIDEVLAEIDSETGAIVICNPNNPTGTLLERKDIKKILKKARLNNAMVLVDEAYYEFSEKTVVDLITKFSNLVVTRTFSKAFGLAGLRLGYLVSCGENIAQMRKVASPYSVSTVTAAIGEKAIQNNEYVKKYVEEVAKAKKIAEKGFTRLGIEFYPGSGNFILAKFPGKSKEVLSTLRERKILVRDRGSYELLGDCLRIGVGTRKQMRFLLSKLERITSQPRIVFDIDGVLIDVSNSYRKAIRETVEFFSGKKTPDLEIQRVKIDERINNDWLVSKRLLEMRGFNVPLESVIMQFQEIYIGDNFDGAIANEKILVQQQVLKRLAGKATLCILTGRPRKEAEFTLKRFGIYSLFDKIVCLEDCKGNEKPSPFGLNTIAKEFGAGTRFYLGDTLADIECANRAGFEAIGVLPPQNKGNLLRDKMFEAGADKVLDNVNMIKEVLK